MAGKTIKRNITDVLDGLGKNRFKKFVKNLCDRRQEPRIRLGDVEDKDAMDVADVLVSKFTEKGALEVAIEIMKLIDCHDEAQELEEFLKSESKNAGAGACVAAAIVGAQPKNVGAGPGIAPGANQYMVGGKHFVDLHRKVLIKRIRTVPPILDELVDKSAITEEAYSDVKAEKTSQDKMRVLFDTAFTTNRVKDIFYDILMENEPFLMAELKGE